MEPLKTVHGEGASFEHATVSGNPVFGSEPSLYASVTKRPVKGSLGDSLVQNSMTHRATSLN